MHINSTLQQALRFYNQKQFQNALIILQKEIAQYPKHAELHKTLGFCYKSLGQNSPALHYLLISLKITNVQPELHNIVANLYKSSEQFDLAISHYLQAIHLDKPNINYLNNLAFVYLRQNKYKAAKDAFSQSIAINSSQVNAIIGLASVCSKKDEDKQAIELLLNAVKTYPNNYIVINNLALSYKKTHDFKQALYYFNKADTLKPDQPSLQESLAFLYFENGHQDKGLAILKAALELNVYHLGLNSSLAKLLWESGENNFLKHYQLLSLDKMPLSLALDYFYKLIISKQQALAADILTKLDEKYGKTIHLNIAHATLLYEQEHFERAYAQLHIVNKSRELTNEELDWLGRHSLALGYFKEAVGIYQKLVELMPRNQGYWCLLSTALRQVDFEQYKTLCCYEDLVFIVDIDVPQGYSTIEEFNQALLKELSSVHVTQQQPLEQSLVGGTQTLGRIFNYDNDIFNLAEMTFRETINTALANIELQGSHPTKRFANADFEFIGAWSVWLKAAGYHKNHYHSEGWYSGVYYIQTPDESELSQGAGYLKFGEADLSLPLEQGPDFCIKPKPGQMVLFPSFIWHGTLPFSSTTPRVSIAFDIAPQLN